MSIFLLTEIEETQVLTRRIEDLGGVEKAALSGLKRETENRKKVRLISFAFCSFFTVLSVLLMFPFQLT